MKYFFVGIKGVGVVGLATLYKNWGHEVSGSDTEEEFFTDAILKRLNISIYSLKENHITSDIDVVIYSSAYSAHPQVEKSKELGIKIQSYSEALAELFNTKKGIVVTGTHGKTTSSAMLGRILEDADFDPTVIVGGEVLEWKSTVRAGSSDWMVAEGDEYQEKILALSPHAVLFTNMEYDHPDFYPDKDSYEGVFAKLLQGLPESALVVAHVSLESFVERHTKAQLMLFDEKSLGGAALGVWGKHNRANAAGAFIMACALGVPEEIARTALENFRGTKRRMELYTKENAQLVVIDDYAHHPTEIRATLRALREQYPERIIIALFQPHTYSRTKALLGDFAESFQDADEAVVLDIYASAREKEKSISGEELYEKVQMHHPNAHFAKNLEEGYEIASRLIKDTKKEYVVVTLGAGDVWRIAERFSKE